MPASTRLLLLFVLFTWHTFALGEEPALPSGLGGMTEEPSLPSGLGEPPTFLDEDDWQEESWQLNGFGEVRMGDWLNDEPFLEKQSLAEMRLNVDADLTFNEVTFNVSADLLYDDLVDDHDAKLETGQGWLDLRAANIVFSPNAAMDVKVGRQTLTWGTGDLIFINDLFPKDWNSFLIGRDDTYLKAPSDALKVSLFSEAMNVDLVYSPRFDADRYIKGERVSYYNANLERIAGTDAITTAEKPDDWFDDDEFALRLYRNLGAAEFALYGYHGFWKSPAGVNPVSGDAIFPRLNVYGTSLRGPVLGGIANIEWGYYDSKDDADGEDAWVNNGEQRLLLGYERELISNLILGLQFYTTRMLDYSAYRQSLPASIPLAREQRHEVATRLTWLALSQKLRASLFVRYSTSDKDYYLRPNVRYSVDDHWSYEFGANIFDGKKAHTFFGQFEHNDNIYFSLRYGF